MTNEHKCQMWGRGGGAAWPSYSTLFSIWRNGKNPTRNGLVVLATLSSHAMHKFQLGHLQLFLFQSFYLPIYFLFFVFFIFLFCWRALLDVWMGIIPASRSKWANDAVAIWCDMWCDLMWLKALIEGWKLKKIKLSAWQAITKLTE